MKIQQFLDWFQGFGLSWKLDEEGCICDTEGEQCPLNALYDALHDWDEANELDYIQKGMRLGLTVKQAAKIAAAADNRGRSPQLREKLLEACGLEVQK